MTCTRNVLLYGREDPLPKPIRLRAGPVSMLWEEGALRWIRLGDIEVLHGICVVVRDRTWGTVPAEISNVRLVAREDSFDLSYDVRHREGEIDFCWQGYITGTPDGVVMFEMDGRAGSAFETNRTGFSVLHPAACAGKRCCLEDVHGRRHYGFFPDLISPQQPFADIRAISYEVRPGFWVEVRMEGDTFEMEDQRNWTDASFKSYAPPIALPFPVRLESGAAVCQIITLSLKGRAPQVTPQVTPVHRARSVTLDIRTEPIASFPKLGVSVASYGGALSDREKERLRALGLHHLRAELNLQHREIEESLRRAAQQSAQLGLPLEAVVIVGREVEAELQWLADSVHRYQPAVWAWLFIDQNARAVSGATMVQARALLGALAPGALFGSGSGANYCELNRQHPPSMATDLVCYGLCPQVHAFDNASLIETLPMQALSVRNARRIAGRLPLLVSPVTLRKRFEPGLQLLSGAQDDPSALPPQVDPRQMSLFGAAWTLGSFKYLAESGVEFMTYYETAGPLGVQDAESGPHAPDGFDVVPGGVYPMYHVFAELATAGGEVLRTVSDQPGKVEALAWRQGAHLLLMLANLTAQCHQVIPPSGLLWRECWRMNEETAETAMREPEAFQKRRSRATVAGSISLRPFEVMLVAS